MKGSCSDFDGTENRIAAIQDDYLKVIYLCFILPLRAVQ
ncbi:hypothetical protein C3B55_00398 [Candidatus Pseudomonas adelgestsugas]|uniref:Uncharacterized protein n=1 Tax=Candidatus Pseudomonas adelgestsugas TaxID=1302376 RepID=A0ABX5R7X5_9PSED|nr:hypothetical protein C3B55_00398 [Candidatus Pseudomonas adelgestsugas]